MEVKTVAINIADVFGVEKIHNERSVFECVKFFFNNSLE